jgi:DNA-binding CsgD family transcriptional regulator
MAQRDLTIGDLRAALRLAGELRELTAGSLEQRTHVLEGLLALVGGQVGIWAVVELGPLPRLKPVTDLGWESDSERAAFLSFVDHQRAFADPSMEIIGRRMVGPCNTFRRDELVTNRDWYGSAHVQELRRTARVDDFLYSGRLDGHRVHAFSIHRPWGARAFGDRERALVDVIHGECAFLHAPPRAALDADLLDDLPPRLRDVLQALARGLSEKQVAAELQLSAHTVHDYVKALHRRFGVASRGELLALVLGAAGHER